ncbi:MAG: 16S rRNA (cytosine(1402)-N(4))-methyltransferase RsmH [Anaerolineaceae bacterium]|nr:16S rRNA (cytosine(1402)-N(4))-methyltransferase RsmH [Anaerolineaceae bacterium]
MATSINSVAGLHQPVLYHEIILALNPKSPKRYVDGTVGAGGHAWGILKSSEPESTLLGLDVDPQALAAASQRLAIFGDRVVLRQASYTAIQAELQKLGWGAVAGIVLDLGVSSIQLDTPERGFSFQSDAPLDMRFNPAAGKTAADLINSLPEEALAALLWQYGEERHSRRIARAICAARPLHTTGQLAQVIARASQGKKNRIHPATRTFQALRIAVNEELQALESVLPQAMAALEPGGRLAVIAFHSLEDRIIKQFFRQESKDCICPASQPICTCGHQAILREVTRRPVVPSKAEIEQNSRARSARLRVAEKL